MASPFFVRPMIRAEPPLSSQFDLAALLLVLAACSQHLPRGRDEDGGHSLAPGARPAAIVAKRPAHPLKGRGRPSHFIAVAARQEGVSPPQPMVWPVAFQSARKVSRPLSVSGCLTRPFSVAGGTVATSAPIRAASRTWFIVRIEAARISVSKP